MKSHKNYSFYLLLLACIVIACYFISILLSNRNPAIFGNVTLDPTVLKATLTPVEKPPLYSHITPTQTIDSTGPLTPTTIKVTSPRYVEHLTLEELTSVFEKAQTSNCVLPCYFGITPGKTSWIDAKKVLKINAGISDYKLERVESFSAYFFTIAVGSADQINVKAKYLVSIEIFVDDYGIVQKIYCWYITREQKAFPIEFWNFVSPTYLFQTLGTPDTIYSYSVNGGSLGLLYKVTGVIGVYGMYVIDGKFCPGDKTSVEVIHLFLYNPDYEMDILFPMNIFSAKPGADIDTYFKNHIYIEKFIGFSKEQLYSKLMNDQSICFDAIGIKPGN